MEIIIIAFIIMQTLFVFWLFILTLKVNKLKENLKENSRMKKEMEQLFESYLMDMRMENEALIKQLEKSSFQNRTTKNSLPKSKPQDRFIKQAQPQVQASFGVDDMIAELRSKNSMSIQQVTSGMDQITYKKPAHSVARAAVNSTAELPSKAGVDKPVNTTKNIKEKNKEIPSLTIGKQMVGEHVEKEEVYAQSLTAQALLLKEQGLSTDEIAKQLNKGKTELELLLKFRQ